MTQGKRVGYIRVSTHEQNPDRQLEGVQLDRRFVDYASAKSTDRPQLRAMLDFVREDDIVIVHSMDRLARNVWDLKSLVNSLVNQKIQIQFMKESLVFSSENSAASNLVLHMMGAFAEFEYAFLQERQREGIAIAKKLGRYKGRPKSMTPDKVEMMQKALSETRKSKSQIAADLGVSRNTLYKHMNIIEKRKAQS